MIFIITLLTLVFIILLLVILFNYSQQKKIQHQTNDDSKAVLTLLTRLEERHFHHQTMVEGVNRLLQDQQHLQQQEKTQLAEHQLTVLKTLQDSMQSSMSDMRLQITGALNQHADSLGKRVMQLTQTTDQRLQEISGQVEKRLSEGFEKTTATFTDVVKRLALIDEAQKKITELSANIVNLQAVFTDKRARGAFGEVQLADLVRNVLPEAYFELQCTLSNQKRVDCLLKLPEPNGHIAIDAKFPLENYRLMIDMQLTDLTRQSHEQKFRRDIQKHINDIAQKYIILGETADSALMFVPAEAIFSEIHAHYPDLVEIAQKAHVWIVSPTTMWAILTTARAVIKDVATRKQVHIIQKHLNGLKEDFARFQTRMDKLALHIKQAHEDTQNVHTSAKKITAHFGHIEQVEFTHESVALLKTTEQVEE